MRVEDGEADAASPDANVAAESSHNPRYAEVRRELASILQDLRPEDVDHATKIAESIHARKKLSPAAMVGLLVMLVPVGWLTARAATEFAFHRLVARDATRLAQKIESYRGETGLYPDAAVWNVWVNGVDAASFQDPWQRPYLYSVDSRAFSIATYGSDGRPGGRWQNRDVNVVFPYLNPRMALPHAQPKSSDAAP
jgi:hypothetical protein